MTALDLCGSNCTEVFVVIRVLGVGNCSFMG